MGNRERLTIGGGNPRGQKRETSFSKRAMDGKLTVEEKLCPKCHHHKALSTADKVFKCSRCGFDHTKSKGGSRGD